MLPAVAWWTGWSHGHMTHSQDVVSLYYTNYLGYQIYNVGWRGDKMLRVGPNGVSIVHEEHHTATLPPGNYRVTIAREFDYVGRRLARYVRD